jgi:ABC-2 type transport system permease protein
MSFVTVAKKDLRDSIRSRWLWVLTVLFVLFTAGIAYAFSVLEAGTEGDLTTLELLFFLQSPASLLIPIIALVISYKAVVGERDSGSLKVLLSLPHTRGDMILGKIIGRSTSLAAAVTIGFVTALLVIFWRYAEFDAGAYALFFLITLLFALTFIAVGVGMSSLVSTSSRALAAAIGFWVVFEFLWGALIFVLYYVTNGFSLDGFDATDPPNWLEFIQGITPGTAYGNAVTALLPENPNAVPGEITSTGDVPLYLEDWFGIVILVGWLLLIPTLGYLRFRAADLS